MYISYTVHIRTCVHELCSNRSPSTAPCALIEFDVVASTQVCVHNWSRSNHIFPLERTQMHYIVLFSAAFRISFGGGGGGLDEALVN